VRLVWQESGGLPVRLPIAAGAGSQIIDAAVSNIGLRSHRLFHRSGLRVLMDLPQTDTRPRGAVPA
jgi:two-component sensor histidine kinase